MNEMRYSLFILLAIVLLNLYGCNFVSSRVRAIGTSCYVADTDLKLKNGDYLVVNEFKGQAVPIPHSFGMCTGYPEDGLINSTEYKINDISIINNPAYSGNEMAVTITNKNDKFYITGIASNDNKVRLYKENRSFIGYISQPLLLFTIPIDVVIDIVIIPAALISGSCSNN